VGVVAASTVRFVWAIESQAPSDRPASRQYTIAAASLIAVILSLIYINLYFVMRGGFRNEQDPVADKISFLAVVAAIDALMLCIVEGTLRKNSDRDRETKEVKL
jgi:hypothetical protein